MMNFSAVQVRVELTAGSAPRDPETTMLVTPHDITGTIGGGTLEYRAVSVARNMLAEKSSEPKTIGYPLGPALGQCCGGHVTLEFTPLSASEELQWTERQKQAVILPAFYVFGAGHIALALSQQWGNIPARLEILDPRPERLALFPGRKTTLIDEAEAEDLGRQFPDQAMVLVMTHCHALDLKLTMGFLRHNRFAFLGLIGSDTKKARFTRQYKAAGILPEAYGRLTSPVGIEGIRSKHPSLIAASVIAQFLINAELINQLQDLRKKNVTRQLSA